MLQAHRDELEEASMAKAEAEAHARMLQASIARYDRLKKEVESFSADPSQMLSAHRPSNDTRQEESCAAPGDADTGGGHADGSASNNSEWGGSASETSWRNSNAPAAHLKSSEEDVSGKLTAAGETADLGEAIGIPKEGWQPVKRSPGEHIMSLLAPVVAAVTSSVSAAPVKGSVETVADEGSAGKDDLSTSAEADGQTALVSQSDGDGTQRPANVASGGAQDSAGAGDIEDELSALDREIEMELEAKLQVVAHDWLVS
jgi:hypothetical protein